MLEQHRRVKRNKSMRSPVGAAIISEFGAVFCAVALLVVVPLVYLTLASCGVALISFFAERSLVDASEAGTFDKAVAVISKGERVVRSSGFSSLLRVRLAPEKTSAMNLYVVATDLRGNNVGVSKPNSSFVPTRDKPGLMFSYRLDTSLEVEPLTALQTQIPLLSLPIRLTLTSVRHVEHCDFTFKD